jgi:hypothetical protein
MEECIPMDGGCNWNVSTGDWRNVSLAANEIPPLQLSGRDYFIFIFK